MDVVAGGYKQSDHVIQFDKKLSSKVVFGLKETEEREKNKKEDGIMKDVFAYQTCHESNYGANFKKREKMFRFYSILVERIIQFKEFWISVLAGKKIHVAI